jgi:hypothetical protein
MFRRLLRAGIEDVRAGRDPKGLNREEGAVIQTYTQNAVVKVAKAEDPAEDKMVLREVGRRVAAGEFRD